MNPNADLAPATATPLRKTKTRLLAAGVAGILVLAPVAAVATHSAAGQAKSASSRAIAAVLGSGVMTKFPNGFRGNDPATRSQLALALQRSAPRVAFSAVSVSVGTGTSAEVGAVRLKIDGAPGKTQGVLITFNGQVDHDTALSAGCFPSFSITRNASPSVVASRSQEEYAGGAGLELPFSATFLLTETTNTSVNYHLALSNPCDQTVFVDGGSLSAQNVVLAGTGKSIQPVAKQQIAKIAPHDR